jgi:hypothetical protein
MPGYSRNYLQRTDKRTCSFDVDSPVLLPLYMKKRTPISEELKILTFEYMCTSFIGHIVVNFEKYSITYLNIIPSNKWNSLSIDISKHWNLLNQMILRPNMKNFSISVIPFPTSDVVGFNIRNIKLRPYNNDEFYKNKTRLLYGERKKMNKPINLNDYFNTQFQCEITDISTSIEEIIITGYTCLAYKDLYVIEIPVFSEFSTKEFISVGKIESDENDFFTLTTSRYSECDGLKYDRIYSRWAIAIQTENDFSIASYARYSNNNPTCFSVPEIIPKNKKGLGDYSLNDFESDLDDLEISYITINIRLNDFLRYDYDKSHISFEYNGKTYYADNKVVEEYDNALLSAAKRNIIVHAIILVYPENKSRDKVTGRILEHPEYDTAGAYTMPNLTNIESVNLYIAAIDFLASRYSRSDNIFGTIHRWIVHNEIDSAWIWCNAGLKTPIELVDIYIKSMRIIYMTTFKYNANTEIFISLTHHWKSRFDNNCYTGEEIFKLIIEYSKKEGDFLWGLAYHPYPENLIDPKSWLDPNATGDYNTKLITFKNIELLDKIIKQPSTFYKNTAKRTLILSEQNPNSLDYTDQSLNEQAESLKYVLEKIKKCDDIKAYIAHSWIDQRFEAGLKTGLRKYLDDQNDPGGKKTAWYVFKSK